MCWHSGQCLSDSNRLQWFELMLFPWLRRVYDLYCDYVLKNPFYEVEMPIRCELFDQNLFRLINSVHRRWGVIQ